MKILSPCLIILTLSWYVLACSSPNIGQTKPFPVGNYEYAGNKGNELST